MIMVLGLITLNTGNAQMGKGMVRMMMLAPCTKRECSNEQSQRLHV